jgi:hypothetical protein
MLDSWAHFAVDGEASAAPLCMVEKPHGIRAMASRRCRQGIKQFLFFLTVDASRSRGIAC